MSQHKIIIGADGRLKFLYSDELTQLVDRTGGDAEIVRCSDVEPDEKGNWTADLSRVGGPVLGPFKLRQEALDAEVEWLSARGLPDPVGGK
jgi:hypothetical protein